MLPIPPHPWHTVSMIFIIDLPPIHGYKYVVDLFTKIVHFIACKCLPTAKETVQLFLDHMISRLISDSGSQFTSMFWMALFQLLNVQVSLSSAHHPATNNEAEKTNQLLQQYLRCYCTYRQNNRPSLFPQQNVCIVTFSIHRLL